MLATAAEQPAAIATDGAILAPTAAPTEVERAEAPTSVAAWVAGIVGIAGVGARWYLKRRQTTPRRAATPAIMARAIPAPHMGRTRVRV